MENIELDWNDLEKELSKFQINHKEYVKKIEEVDLLKKKYLDQFTKYKKKLASLDDEMTKLEKASLKAKKNEEAPTNNEDGEDQKKEKFDSLKIKINDNITYMRQISDTFPRQNGIYLKIIIGGVCVSILNKEEKWKYKEEYEKFKFIITLISLCLSFFLCFIQSFRIFDAILNFLLVWYYCTLTIRESILVVNGSKINAWWISHHFITTVCTAVLLIWPDSPTYEAFRMNQIRFSCFISFVQLLQYYYQKGCLYRLRALGEKEDMDTTVEGYASWMSRGLSFLLPFLFIGYGWELYNSYTLFYLSISPECHEWQVPLLSGIYFVLFCGNFLTTYSVIRKKFKDRIRNLVWIKHKYKDWKKLSTPLEEEESKNR